MKFEYFEIRNFKGIEDLRINLIKSPKFNVHAFVGLNESGKTTVLEAINFFKHKTETLESLELKGYKVEDIHDLIPISKRANFNGYIEIKAGLVLDDSDERLIAQAFKNDLDCVLTEKCEKISFTQKYFFENSKSLPDKDSLTWEHSFIGRKGKSKTARSLKGNGAGDILPFIKTLIPNILYFPNFLFEFPSKIYLNPAIEDKKYTFYQGVVQDILDSLNNRLTLDTHIIKRAVSTDRNDKRHLQSVLDNMGAKVTAEVFDAWSKIFNKVISKKEIIINQDEDDNGIYLEFLLKDSDGQYLINERSLGFRWFFVFLLLTQFRGYRKNNNENSLFLLDEPASNLHSSAQSQLLQSFEKLSEVIYTTHSHHLINPLWLENTYVVKNEGLDYGAESDNFNSSKTKIVATPYREFAVRYPLQKSYFQPILDVLDYAPNNLEFIDKSVFVEGKNDFYTYNYFQKVIINNGKKSLNFIPGTSAGNMDTLISLYLGWGKRFLILLDSDAAGKKQKKRYIDIFGAGIENIIFTYNDIDTHWTDFGVESIYSKEDMEKIYFHFYPDKQGFTKTNFHRSIQELLIKNERVELNSNTIISFQKVLEFLFEKIK